MGRGIGTISIIPRSKGSSDLSGRAVITTANGEKGNYTIYPIGHTDANGTCCIIFL